MRHLHSVLCVLCHDGCAVHACRLAENIEQRPLLQGGGIAEPPPPIVLQQTPVYGAVPTRPKSRFDAAAKKW